MSSTKWTARSIGVLYLVTMLPAPLNLIYMPGRFIVRGDAAATARNIADAELLYRLCTLAGFFNSIMFIVLGLSLYNLFKDVDRKQARLMVAFVAVSAAISLANLINEIAPLVLLSGADFLSAFSKPQLDALALGFLRLRDVGIGIATAFWGLWLLPFGILAHRSGFTPRLIGVLLIVGCFGYLAQSVTFIVLPALTTVVTYVTLPLAAPGEFVMIIWLLVKGGTVLLPVARPANAG